MGLNTHHKIALKRPYMRRLKLYILYVCNITLYLWCVSIINNRKTRNSFEFRVFLRLRSLFNYMFCGIILLRIGLNEEVRH
nr:MAG TPA: hypothetical protein [Caudoviricetes sp.]